MHRLLVALLAALDALLAAAVGIAVVLAPLALMWVVALGDADWSALWPSAAAVWHLGHLVPITVTLPDAYLAATGVDPSVATFTLSLAPLAFATFTGLFAARSGIRAAESGAALTGWLSGSLVFAAIAALVALTSAAPLVSFELWHAILFPTLIFAVPSLVGAVVGAWRVGDEGPVDRVRAWLGRMPTAWAPVPTLVLRGLALTTLGLVAVGGVVVAVGLLARGAQIITLFQASNVDAIGATVLALGQLVYLPTLVLWAVAFVAGPGFALGTDTAVTPAATQVGAIPGIPILGIVPESTTTWLLLLALLPVAVGAVTGWILRSQMPERGDHEPTAPRLVIAVVVAAFTGGVGALIAVVASGSIGPGRLVETGPHPGPLALALGLEVLVGLAILLLGPRRALPSRSVHSDRGLETAPALRDRPSGALLTGAVPSAAAVAPWLDEHADRATDADRDADADADRVTDDRVAADDDVQARIRDAWARIEPVPAEWRDDPASDATGGRDPRPVD
ncbi:cell division protein PerM [Microbacterium enclense]|uniref:cell division protein PerM n=1 Tax=Microbacterium enclense TaxID=993073 RepID=UPI00197B8A52|nr:DUF6350 family protein [Microbacterium enclense]